MPWVLDWFDAVKETYKRIIFFDAKAGPDPDLATIGHNMEEYEDQYAAAMTFELRLLARQAAISFLFMGQLTPEERTPIREAGFQGFRVSGAQMLDNAIPPIAAGMRPANARLITAALRDTRDDWAKLILPDDRSRIIILVAKVQAVVKDDEAQKNLAVFADRLSAEQGNAK